MSLRKSLWPSFVELLFAAGAGLCSSPSFCNVAVLMVGIMFALLRGPSGYCPRRSVFSSSCFEVFSTCTLS